MKALVTYLFSDYRALHEAKWLRRLLYVFLLYKCLYLIIDFDVLFSAQNFVYKHQVALGSVKKIIYLLYYSQSSCFAGVLILAVSVLAVNGLFLNYFSRLCAILIWLIVCNINSAVYTSLTAGDYLFQLLLFFNIFLSGQKQIKNNVWREVDIALHNFGVLALKVQICFVYLMTGLAKLNDSDWLSGNAMVLICRTEEFGIPFLYNHIFSHHVLLKLTGYFVIAYQISFSFLVWIKKIKKSFLLIGIIQHLYIAFIMGLPSFGIIMIFAYSIFYFPSLNKKT